MPKFPVLKSKEIIRVLKKVGYEEIRTVGSHIHFKRGNNLVTVPFHNTDLKIKTLKSIISQAGITVGELKNLL